MKRTLDGRALVEISRQDNDLVEDRPLRLKYYLRIPNVGDLVNANIVEHLTGVPTQYCAFDEQPHLLAAGSILSSASNASMIWGTGLMHPKFGLGNVDPSSVLALRGKLTLAKLQNATQGIPDVPLGDPGVLAPELFGITAQSQPKYRLGVAAHYVDRNDPRIRALLAEEGVLDLNVHLPPEEFIGQMASCAVVASSSLHGLIFAEAMGIPNLWVEVTDAIEGEGFKFRDWYSTTARPQDKVHILGVGQKAQDLIDLAAPRESTIDRSALKDALSLSRLEHVREDQKRKFYPAAVCRKRATPCFFISYNRGGFLRQAIEGLRDQNQSVSIIVHDNGSTDQATLEELDKLEAEGCIVSRNPAIRSADDLNQVNESVSSFFNDWAEPQRYVVSDCDVDLSEAGHDAIEVYGHALNLFRYVETAGPMIRISDIPHHYPLRKHALNLHISQFWKNLPKVVELGGKPVGSLQCVIDTTFALHRAGEPFRRLKSAVRLYAPYDARHLDWYLTAADLETTTDQGGSDISHWADAEWKASFSDEELKFPGFFDVVGEPDGTIRVRWRSLPDAPFRVSLRLFRKRLQRRLKKLRNKR